MAIYLYSASIVFAVLAIQTNFDINIKCICDHHLPWKEILKLSFLGDISSIASKFREKKRIQFEASPSKRQGLVEINEQHRSYEMRQSHGTMYCLCIYTGR